MRGPFCFPGVAALSGAVLQGEVRRKDRDVMSANEELLGRPVPGCMLSEYYLLVPSASERLGRAEEDGAERRSFGGATPPCAGPYSGRSEWRTHLESHRWVRDKMEAGRRVGVWGDGLPPGLVSEFSLLHCVAKCIVWNRCCQCKASSRWAEELSTPHLQRLQHHNPSTSSSYAIAAHLTSSDSNTTTTKDSRLVSAGPDSLNLHGLQMKAIHQIPPPNSWIDVRGKQ
ncbi:unnamed protein product [Boreogadus saida]